MKRDTRCARPLLARHLAATLMLLLPLSVEAALYQFTTSVMSGVTQVNGGAASLPGTITITAVADTNNAVFGPQPQFPTVPQVVMVPLDRLSFSGPGVSGEFAEPGVMRWQQASPSSLGIMFGGTTLGPFTPGFANFGFWSNPAPFQSLSTGIVLPTDASTPTFLLTSGDVVAYRYTREPSVRDLNFAATPVVPEPGALALWAVGLLALCTAAGRRRVALR